MKRLIVRINKYMNCRTCNKILNKKNRKFCNSSCSASYNNTKRIKRPESNLKTALTIKNKSFKNIKCTKCNKDIYVKLIKKTGNICKSCKEITDYNYRQKIKNKFCKACNCNIKTNKTMLCKTCWIKSDSFKIQRGNVKKHFKRGYYICKESNKEVFLSSGLEFKFADFCDKNNIKWIQPEPLKYTFLNKTHLYFPDFYLIDYDLYIELKGYFWGKDRDKMTAIKQSNKDKKIKIIMQKQFNKITGVGELVDPPDFESGA